MIKKEFISISRVKKEYLKDETDKSESIGNSEKPFRKPRIKGMNKNRRKFSKLNKDEKICSFIKSGNECPYGDKCCYKHDIDVAKIEKVENLPGPCYNYNIKGFCSMGAMCRFSTNHMSSDGQINIKNEEVFKSYLSPKNYLNKETQKLLRKKTYDFNYTMEIMNTINMEKQKLNQQENMDCSNKSDLLLNDLSQNKGSVLIEDGEKQCFKADYKKLDLTNKLYLAPLTTLGNLPFRRICVELGAEVTCSEMAMAYNLLDGNKKEWALLKRHNSERIFGIQICGSKVDIVSKAAQLIEEQCEFDFLDLNCGCPLDIVCNYGGGCGLIRHNNSRNKLINIVQTATRVLRHTPMTVKTRVGFEKQEMTIHELLPQLYKAGSALVAIHGRTRHQRYTRLADWNYVNTTCVPAAEPMPIIGNGDILTLEDYQDTVSTSKCSTIMIGRGALIKPWLFSEIQSNKSWDISSNERLDILKKFVNYGLEHWGSDSRGVETTRMFLLEWLSFLHRYIPIGLLERPQRINEKPPLFTGRDYLETMMGSPDCLDWIRISEMLLGPVPSQFHFIPKHKANSYELPVPTDVIVS